MLSFYYFSFSYVVHKSPVIASQHLCWRGNLRSFLNYLMRLPRRC
ncbi:hypothetical protein [Rickettsia felis]|nr:hypothetical protein [Rickettsia felis]